jgi:hypothetical protein
MVVFVVFTVVVSVSSYGFVIPTKAGINGIVSWSSVCGVIAESKKVFRYITVYKNSKASKNIIVSGTGINSIGSGSTPDKVVSWTGTE